MIAKVLIVDDEKVIRDSLELLLKEEGYKADTSTDGEDALEKIKQEGYPPSNKTSWLELRKQGADIDKTEINKTAR